MFEYSILHKQLTKMVLSPWYLLYDWLKINKFQVHDLLVNFLIIVLVVGWKQSIEKDFFLLIESEVSIHSYLALVLSGLG